MSLSSQIGELIKRRASSTARLSIPRIFTLIGAGPDFPREKLLRSLNALVGQGLLYRHPGRRYSMTKPHESTVARLQAERLDTERRRARQYAKRPSVKRARKKRYEAKVKAEAGARYQAVKARHLAKREARAAAAVAL